MPSAYIYMEPPQTGEVLTLGRLTLSGNRPGEFIYSPAAQDEADPVAGWADELKEYYADFLQGKVLELARNATTAQRILG